MLDGFKNEPLKLGINIARFLLKSFQPIHRLINSSSKIYKFKRLKIKNEILIIGLLIIPCRNFKN